MSLTTTELEHIEDLAYLDGASEDNQSLIDEINSIMDFIEHLQKVDTAQVAPLFHPLELNQRLREDTLSEENRSEELSKLTNNFQNNLYEIRHKVIDVG